MPRDVPYGEDWQVLRRGALSARFAPVPCAEAAMAAARRAFRIEKSEQLPLRARLLDVLEHLDRGHLLVLLGGAAPAVWLDGQPDVTLLAGVLFCYGYVQIVGRHRDNANIVYFALSPAGARKLREGRAWWNSLSFWERLKVRVCG
jgi:hypothetical protein